VTVGEAGADDAPAVAVASAAGALDASAVAADGAAADASASSVVVEAAVSGSFFGFSSLSTIAQPTARFWAPDGRKLTRSPCALQSCFAVNSGSP